MARSWTARASSLIAALVLAAAPLLWPAGALAEGATTPLITPPGGPSSPLSPFQNQGPLPTTTTTTPTVTQTSTTGGGLSGGGAVAIGIGALVVLGGICFYIWQDARKRAPVRRKPVAATADGPRQRPQKTRKLSPAERKRRKRGRAR